MSVQNSNVQINEVPCFEVFEAEFACTGKYSNPFTEIMVYADFISPSSRKLKAYGFYDGENIWRIRIAPDEAGVWSYTTSASNTSDTGLHNRTGVFTCVASSGKGFIHVDPIRKYWFSYSDGSHFYGMGDTCYGMVNGISNKQLMEYLDKRSAQKFNFVRFFVSGFPQVHHPSLSTDESWPWGGTAENPDFDQFNPFYFRRLEGIIKELGKRGMYAEMEVFNLYLLEHKHGNHIVWFSKPERREQWVQYIVSRLSAYTEVFLWTVANEYTLFPDGIYRYDGPSDDKWARDMGTLIHKYDPHTHPTTVHPETVRFTGHVFGSGDEIDVITHQQNSYSSATWFPEPFPGYQDGPGTEAGRDILADRWYNKPVINTENGYEWLEGYGTDHDRQNHSTDKCRRTAWRIFISGGAAYAAGFQGTWSGRDGAYWHNRRTRKKDGPLPFVLDDMGLARQLGFYYQFITEKTDFRRMDPAMSLVNQQNLCLAAVGKEYIIYAPTGGNITLDLSGTTNTFSVEWLNPRSGVYNEEPCIIGGSSYTFTAADNNDWVLHLKIERGYPCL
jgi:hypothetical protein